MAHGRVVIILEGRVFELENAECDEGNLEVGTYFQLKGALVGKVESCIWWFHVS